MEKICIVLRYFVLLSLLSQIKCQYFEEDYDEEVEESDVVQAQAVTLKTNQTSVNNSLPISNATMDRVIGQVNNVLSNVENLNITGIVDQALGFRNNTRIRTMVNSIMAAVFCNPFFANYNNCGHLKTQIVLGK